MPGRFCAPRTPRTARAWIPALVALALTSSCSSVPSSPGGATGLVAPGEPGAETSPPRVQPAIDLTPVIRHTALGFRRSGARGELTAVGATFEVAVTGAALAITPRRAEIPVGPPLAGAHGAPLSLETSLVARGSRVLADGSTPSRTTLERDGAVTVLRGEVTERFENDEGGVEQSWRFERAPSGDGDLEVRVRASGELYTSSTDHGLHFASPGGIGLRYGTATWVDANGTRTTVTPRFAPERGEIVLRVPSDVLASSPFPAVLDPTLTPEQEIDMPVSGSSASGEQYNATITSAGPGKGYFAVWYDRRGVRPSLYGARIASNGTVLDDTGVPVAVGVGSTTPFISASDDGFLVTWTISYVDLYQGPGVYGVRLDATGKALDAAPIVIAPNQTNVQQPSSAWGGASWLVAWQRYGGGPTSYDIVGARVPRTGAVLDATPIEISKGTEAEYQPVVTFDGTNQLVTWRSNSAIYGRKYGSDGAPLTPRLTLATAANSSLSYFQTAFDGTRHLLVWSDYGASSYDIFARRISLAGTPIDAGNLSIAIDANSDQRPRAAWDGGNFVITWARSSALMAIRLSATGGLLDAAPLPVNSDPTISYYDHSLASDGASNVVVSRAGNSGLAGSDVVGVNLGKPAGGNKPTYVVSKAANSETEPVTAWNGTSHFTVWLDTRDGRPALYGASTTADGQASAPTKVVSEARFPSELTRPRIASDGSGYLVVFYANDTVAAKRGIRGVHVDATGTVDPAGVFDIYIPPAPNDNAQEPDVAFDGTNYLVVWQNVQNDGSSQTSINGVRVSKGANAALDPEPISVTTSTPVETRTAPSVAWDGQSYYVSWITSRPTAAGGIQVSHVFGTRVSKEGAVLDGEQVICNAFLLQRAPFVAGDPKNGGFMVVWEDYRTALDTADVYGARVSPDGQNLDGPSGMKIATGSHDESRPRVGASGDGTNWVVAWRDLRSKATYDIYGAWISRAGKVHDPEGLLISAEAGDEDAPWVNPSKEGKLLVSYQRLDPRTGYGSYRVRARSINAGASVTSACTKNDDCASRSCADGVCCATECGACGACNVTPGTCTPRVAGTESPTCPAYKCKGALECPSTCIDDGDCASNATCDPSTKTCVSRVICIDDQTLKDLSGTQTSCAPFKCIADACRTQCGSVDDCAGGFVCDYGGRCVQAPGSNDGGCAVSPSPASSSSSSSSGALLASAVWLALALVARRTARLER
jgi:hypothetical protein